MFEIAPGFTAIPNDFLDKVAPTLTAAELRVALYIYRHTLGYQKLTDAISYSQFTDGITTADGRQLDTGAGISRRSLPTALAGLERRGVICRSGGSSGPVRYTVVRPASTAPVEHNLPTAAPQPGQNLPAPEPEVGQKLPPTKQTESKIKPDRAAVNLLVEKVPGITLNQAEKLVSVAERNGRDISYIIRLVGYVTSVAGNPAAMLTVLINRNEDRTTGSSSNQAGPGSSRGQHESGAVRYMNRHKNDTANLPRWQSQQPIDFSKPIYQKYITQSQNQAHIQDQTS